MDLDKDVTHKIGHFTANQPHNEVVYLSPDSSSPEVHLSGKRTLVLYNMVRGSQDIETAIAQFREAEVLEFRRCRFKKEFDQIDLGRIKEVDFRVCTLTLD